MRVYDTDRGPVPVIDGAAHIDQLTKTEYQRERDDDDMSVACITKSGDPKENQDMDAQLVDAMQPAVEQEKLIALLTKTLHGRESDDE